MVHSEGFTKSMVCHCRLRVVLLDVLITQDKHPDDVPFRSKVSLGCSLYRKVVQRFSRVRQESSHYMLPVKEVASCRALSNHVEDAA